MSILSQTRRSLSSKFALFAQHRFFIRESTTIPRYADATKPNEYISLLPTSEPINFRSLKFERTAAKFTVLQDCYRGYAKILGNSGCQLSYQRYKQYHHKMSRHKPHSGDGEKENHHHKPPNYFDPKTLMSILGVLGLFRGMTSDDIENEKAKLSDEDKMKKMKPVELKIASGVLAMCDQEYRKADECFHDALLLAQEEQDEERELLILNLLASNFFEAGELKEAEKLFIDIMRRLIASGLESTDPAILELSLKLASIYGKNTASHEKALKGFKFVINSLLHHLQDILDTPDELNIQELSDEKKNELALLGWSYDWFAKFLLAVNDYVGAADMLQRALQISSKILGPLHDQTLILLNDVGTTLAMNESPQEGRAFIKKAVEGAIESQSMELASFYVNLGLVELKLKRFTKAKRYCEYSNELASKNREHYNSHEVSELSKSCLNEVNRLLEVNKQ